MEQKLEISVEPVGTERFAIYITGNEITGTRMLHGPDPLGFTEADLRSAGGLPKCGLTEAQIEKAINAANSKR